MEGGKVRMKGRGRDIGTEGGTDRARERGGIDGGTEREKD